MGTRADFYIGRGKDAEWLGSIAWDGHPENFLDLRDTKSEVLFRLAVRNLSTRDDWTAPEQGWPWPWEDSHTTDHAYAWDGDRAYVTHGTAWYTGDGWTDWEASPGEAAEFPNMKDRQNVTLGPRSGVLLVRA